MVANLDQSAASLDQSPALEQQQLTGEVLIFGAGTLGLAVAQHLKSVSPDARILATTKSERNHAKLLDAGAEPHVGLPEGCDQVDSVFFAITPNIETYHDELRTALDAWTGPPGKFVYASSVGVYGAPSEDGAVADESTPVNALSSPSPFAAKQLLAETMVLAAGGTVLRYGGLYSLEPDRNSFYMKGGDLKIRGDRLISLVSYPDAARAVAEVLESAPNRVSGEVFVVNDGHSYTIAETFRAAMTAGKFAPCDAMPTFVEEGSVGRRFDTAKIRSLGWAPRIPSFQEYCKQMRVRGEREEAE